TCTTAICTLSLHDALPIYWETEFPQISPGKNRKGDRRYTKDDIQRIKTIYTLLKVEGFTIDGAKAAYKKRQERDKSIDGIITRLDRKSTRLNSSHVKISYA